MRKTFTSRSSESGVAPRRRSPQSETIRDKSWCFGKPDCAPIGGITQRGSAGPVSRVIFGHTIAIGASTTLARASRSGWGRFMAKPRPNGYEYAVRRRIVSNQGLRVVNGSAWLRTVPHATALMPPSAALWRNERKNGTLDSCHILSRIEARARNTFACGWPEVPRGVAGAA
jgi:hypothetical protein